MKNNDRSVHISIFKISVITLAILGALLFVLKATQSFMTSMKPTKSSNIDTTDTTQKGSFSLISATGRTIFLPQEKVGIHLVADSQSVPVSGYDLLLKDLDSAISLTDAKSTLESFDVRVIDPKKGWINGALRLQEGDQGFAFDETTIAELSFMHPGQGKVTLNIDFVPHETRDSNMMQMDPPQDMLSQVTGTTIYIGSKISLAPDARYTFPQSNVSMTLKSLTVPEGLCNDCSTQAVVEISKGQENRTVTFLLGGIQGKSADTHTMFGYIFETTSITKSGIEIYSALQ